MTKVFVLAVAVCFSNALKGQGQIREATVPLPASMEVCAGEHCLTYTLEAGYYKNYTNLPFQRDEVRTLKIKSFTRDAIIFQETDTGSYPLTAAWSGRMLQGENSVAEGTMYFTSWAGQPTQNPSIVPFRIKWGANAGATGDSDLSFAEVPRNSANSAEVCRSPAIRNAMQEVENKQARSPEGALLGGAACAITGVCGDTEHPENMHPTILQSRPASDSGGFTANDPGSFLCQGLFARGDVHLKTGKDGDLQSELTKDAMEQLLQQFPTFQENFKVRPLRSGRYLLLLIPGISGMPSYSSEFSFPQLKADEK